MLTRVASPDGYIDLYSTQREAKIVRSARIVWLFFVVVIIGLFWSYFAVLDEVATGEGKIIPASRDQIIQSLEGGILSELNVREDDIVQEGQVLARLDETVIKSNVEEGASKYRAALASSVRLQAEVDRTIPKFPQELNDYPDLIATEMQLYTSRKRRLEDSIYFTKEAKDLVASELEMNQALTDRGAASKVEVMRLRRQMAELELKALETESNYIVEAREALSKANSEVESLRSIIAGRSDSLTRSTIRSPVRGIVKNIEVSTIGGVIPPNGKLMDIVPLGDRLLVEARMAPKDIAYIHPEQNATVKLTAYDYAIFGSLAGKVVSISPDTIRDEIKPELYYYRVLIETTDDAMVNELGKRFPIAPGMVATIDVHTGSKTVWQYLTKPLNKAGEALRER
jgi:adhesin transport system membrane fusion protein